MMTDEQLVALVDQEFRSAMGKPDSDIANERAAALDFYHSKKYGTEVEGESEFVTSESSDHVDAMVPSMLRMFTTAENLVSFDPVDEDDVDQAQDESDYVSHIFHKENDSFLIIYTVLYDAFIQKNGIVKAWREEKEVVTHETYNGIDEQTAIFLASRDNAEVAERTQFFEPATNDLGEPMVDEFGNPMLATKYDIKFRVIETEGRIKCGNIAPEHYRISRDANSLDPSSARMVGEERELTRTELIEMGISKEVVDALPTHDEFTGSEEESSRYDKDDEQHDSTSESHADKSEQKILVKEVYLRVDYDDDGRSELRQIMVAGNKVLLNELADRVPYHVFSPQPLPHKHFGRSIVDKVMDGQLLKSHLWREILNNLVQSNRPRYGVWDLGANEDTLDELLAVDAGGVVTTARPVNETIEALTVPFTAGNTFPMLELVDKALRERTGIAPDSEGISPDQLKNIQQSVMSQSLDKSQEKLEAIARIFAETGFKSLFRHIHELAQKNPNKAKMVQLRGKWTWVDPTQWKKRTNMTVNIGLGIGTKMQNAAFLENVWTKIEKVRSDPEFGRMVQAHNIHALFDETAKVANFKQAKNFLTHPDDLPPPAADPQEELIQVQLQLQAGQQQLEQAKHELKVWVERTKAAREDEKVQLQREKQESDEMIELDKIATQLTEIDIGTPIDVPGSLA